MMRGTKTEGMAVHERDWAMGRTEQDGILDGHISSLMSSYGDSIGTAQHHLDVIFGEGVQEGWMLQK
jgi:hypothetical protein